ncbi:MAG: CAP domain-containing protein [Steroidobacteraceae bacterium]
MSHERHARLSLALGVLALGALGVGALGVGACATTRAPVQLAPPRAQDAAAVGARVLTLVNRARARPRRCGPKAVPAASPLVREAQLDAVALAYAQELARLGRFEHRGADGRQPRDRVARSGYRARIVGENLAAGPTTADEVIDGWLASPGHCENVMEARFTQMGIAYAVNPASRYGIIWVQLFAAPR